MVIRFFDYAEKIAISNVTLGKMNVGGAWVPSSFFVTLKGTRTFYFR